MEKIINISAQTVPNPHALKFVVDDARFCADSQEFTSVEKAVNSPLAQKLLAFDYINRVYIIGNFITVNKDEKSEDWTSYIPEIRIIIKKHIEWGEPIFLKEPQSRDNSRHSDKMSEELDLLLQNKINPATWNDGGEMSFESYENGVLKVKLHGACVACPFAPRTIKHGIEVLAQRHFPDVKEVTSDDVDWSKTQQ